MYTDEYLDEINESLELVKRSADNAEKRAEELKKQGVDTYIVKD